MANVVEAWQIKEVTAVTDNDDGIDINQEIYAEPTEFECLAPCPAYNSKHN